MKKSKFPQSFRFQHNGSSLVYTTGVKYVEKLDGYFFLHWESLWPGVVTLLLFLASLLLVLGASWGEPMNTVLELLTELELATPDTGTLRTALLV